MTRTSAQTAVISLTRRDLIKSLAAIVGAALSGCAPVRVGLRMYPDEFDRDASRVDRVLRAFVETVVPGVDVTHHNLVRHFYDEDYPLASFRNFVAAGLCDTAHRVYGVDRFPELAPEQRIAVIQSRLDAGGTTQRLFTGAIFLTQIATYAGIYDNDEGSPLIGFQGKYRVRALTELSYPDCDSFAARQITADGNPA